MTNSLIKKVCSMGGLVIEIWTEDFQHAIDGHPEVTLDKVIKALKDPFKVIQSNSSGIVCLFYSVEITIHETENLFFCVVVSTVKSGKGKMITAYNADFIKTGKNLFSK